MFKALLLWSVLGANVPDIRDKFGTTFWDIWLTSALYIGLDKACKNQTERGGFEPPVRLPPHSISSAAQSAALPPLQPTLKVYKSYEFASIKCLKNLAIEKKI